MLAPISLKNEPDYDESKYDDARLKEDIATLHKDGLGSFGTNEKGLFRILCSAPAEYMQKLNLGYAEEHGFTLTKALEKELRGDSEKAALFLAGMKLKPYEEVARLIDTACRGFGTNETLLINTLIRFQSHMKKVEEAHVEKYGKKIDDRIKSETGGDFKKVLLEIYKTGMSM